MYASISQATEFRFPSAPKGLKRLISLISSSSGWRCANQWNQPLSCFVGLKSSRLMRLLPLHPSAIAHRLKQTVSCRSSSPQVKYPVVTWCCMTRLASASLRTLLLLLLCPSSLLLKRMWQRAISGEWIFNIPLPTLTYSCSSGISASHVPALYLSHSLSPKKHGVIMVA